MWVRLFYSSVQDAYSELHDIFGFTNPMTEDATQRELIALPSNMIHEVVYRVLYLSCCDCCVRILKISSRYCPAFFRKCHRKSEQTPERYDFVFSVNVFDDGKFKNKICFWENFILWGFLCLRYTLNPSPLCCQTDWKLTPYFDPTNLDPLTRLQKLIASDRDIL